MAKVTTYTDIANMALDWCGAALFIDDINNDHNPDAILCKRNLEQAITSELDKYEWVFARNTIKADLIEDEECQLPGYFCYELPQDFSRLSMYTFFDYYKCPTFEYQWGHTYLVQNGHLYTKFPLKILSYVSNDVPISAWHSLFKDVVALNLAQRIVNKIRGMDGDVSFMLALYKEKLKDARRLELIGTEATQGGASVLQIQRMAPYGC